MARKNRGMVIKGNVDETTTLGALASNTLVAIDYDETPDEEVFALSQEATWAITGHTVDEGPIVVGFAHSDYSEAEIEEVIENAGSWDRGDLVAQEVARRKVRIVGTFPGDLTEEVLNEGSPIKSPIKWGINTGKTLKLFAYSRHSAPLTAGTLLLVNGHIWLKPR